LSVLGLVAEVNECNGDLSSIAMLDSVPFGDEAVTKFRAALR